MSGTLREQLEKSFAAVESSDDVASEPAGVGVDGSGEVGQGTGTEAASVTEGDAGHSDTLPTSQQEGRARDESGRFSKQEEAKEVTKAPAQAKVTGSGTQAGSGGQSTAPAVPPVEVIKPPQSLTPQEREHFNKAPVEIQRAIVRREKEISQGLQEAAEPKRFHQQFQQTVAPYLGMIQAEGGEPLKAVGSLLQTAAALRTAPPAHKAQIIANMVRTFGVPLETLAAAIDGQPMTQGQTQHQSVDPNVIAQQVMERIQASSRERYFTQAQQEASKFGETHEFFEDVREDMAHLMENATRRGVALTMEQAYDKACKMHDDVSGVMQQRQAAKAAVATQASAQRAKDASSSVRSQPSAAPSAQKSGRSIREVLEDVHSDLSSR
jgi:hypothetical protein